MCCWAWRLLHTLHTLFTVHTHFCYLYLNISVCLVIIKLACLYFVYSEKYFDIFPESKRAHVWPIPFIFAFMGSLVYTVYNRFMNLVHVMLSLSFTKKWRGLRLRLITELSVLYLVNTSSALSPSYCYWLQSAEVIMQIELVNGNGAVCLCITWILASWLTILENLQDEI